MVVSPENEFLSHSWQNQKRTNIVTWFEIKSQKYFDESINLSRDIYEIIINFISNVEKDQIQTRFQKFDFPSHVIDLTINIGFK